MSGKQHTADDANLQMDAHLARKPSRKPEVREEASISFDASEEIWLVCLISDTAAGQLLTFILRCMKEVDAAPFAEAPS